MRYQILNQDADLSLIERLFKVRNISDNIENFLNPTLANYWLDPFLLNDMDKGVNRIIQALKNKEKIVVFWDYDVDWITASYTLYKFITKYLNYKNITIRYPNRIEDGYWMKPKHLDEMKKEGVDLVITVDNWITSLAEANYAKELWITLIITDHHEAPDEVPPAIAIINPKAMNALDEKLTPLQIEYLTSLAGVGVAFKLAQGVLEKYDKLSYSYELLPYVTVGTIADLVPLVGENRYFVTKGLELIAQGKHYGLKRLLDSAGVNLDNGLTAEQVAFTVAPRINASGRIESVDPAIKLLISDNKQEIELSIMQLENLNKMRQQMVNSVFEEADEIWKNSKSRDNAIILSKSGWHIGVIGIVASKFVEKYYKPTFIMTYSEENKTYRCSARGVKELDLYDIITAVSDKFEGYGGHKLAGGFTFTTEKASFEDVKRELNKTVDEMLNGRKLKPSLEVDLELSINEVDSSLVEEISKLEPFGMSNPSPTFVVKNLTLKEKKLMGSTKEHLKLIVEGPNGNIDCVWWSRGDVPLIAGDKLDVAFAPQLNTYNGVTNVQLVLKDVHSDALVEEEETFKQKVYDHRKKTNIYPQVNDYIKGSDKTISVFVENKTISESLKPYTNIYNSIINRLTAKKSDILMFFDYPADDDVLQTVMQATGADTIHYMNYTSLPGKNYEEMLKMFSGMIRYTCNNLNGDFNLERAASALGVTNIVVETMLEMFEDSGMIKIVERKESSFVIEFINTIELSKTLHTIKYAEFAELMNTINDYKNKFMTVELQ